MEELTTRRHLVNSMRDSALPGVLLLQKGSRPAVAPSPFGCPDDRVA